MPNVNVIWSGGYFLLINKDHLGVIGALSKNYNIYFVKFGGDGNADFIFKVFWASSEHPATDNLFSGARVSGGD